MELKIKTSKWQEAIDITDLIEKAIEKEGGKAVLVYSTHTTAGLTINEGYDKDVMEDVLDAIDEIAPKIDYRHKEGNSLAHVKSSLVNSNLVIPIENSKLKLGKYQKIFFLEFDGPKERVLEVKIL